MKRVLISIKTLALFSAVALSGFSSGVSAASTCDAHGIGNKTMTNDTASNSAYKVANGKATITFKVVGKNCKLPVTMVAWTAPNGTDGKPYAQQRMYQHKTDTFSEGLHQMTIDLPNCFYQVDTVTGTALRGSTGQANNYDNRQVGYIHGGTTSCTKKPAPKPTPTPATTTAPPTSPAAPAVTSIPTVVPPTKLTNSGPVDSAAITVLAVSVIGGYVFALHRTRRQNNQ